MTITLVVTGGHERYAPFVQRWWDSVLIMEPRPDEIVAVIDTNDTTGLGGIIDPNEIPCQIIVKDYPYDITYLNDGFGAATHEWVAFCGIDDMMMKNAYADIDQAGDADIIVGSIELSSGDIARGAWDVDALMTQNTLPAHSPFRKQLWVDVGGLPDIRWSDWGFWIKCAKRGVTTYTTNNVTAWFDMGANHETMSGVQVPADVRAAADRELYEFIETTLRGDNNNATIENCNE